MARARTPPASPGTPIHLTRVDDAIDLSGVEYWITNPFDPRDAIHKDRALRGRIEELVKDRDMYRKYARESDAKATDLAVRLQIVES